MIRALRTASGVAMFLLGFVGLALRVAPPMWLPFLFGLYLIVDGITGRR